jgi:hypothetical protein
LHSEPSKQRNVRFGLAALSRGKRQVDQSGGAKLAAVEFCRRPQQRMERIAIEPRCGRMENEPYRGEAQVVFGAGRPLSTLCTILEVRL